MASKRMIRREKKRSQLQRLAPKRKEIMAQIKDPNVDIPTKQTLYEKLEKMPKDSSPIRRRRRCKLTGRGRGVYRKFGLARSELRRRAMLGEIPGLVKASW